VQEEVDTKAIEKWLRMSLAKGPGWQIAMVSIRTVSLYQMNSQVATVTP
jgi:hypothetical protein